MKRTLAACLLFVLTAFPGRALAHPEVDRAAAEVTNGNYEAAQPLLEALLERDDLDLAELTRVLELRAVLSRAMADDPGLDSALRALARLAPDHRFGPRHPPDLEARASRVRAATARLMVRTETLPSPVGVRLTAEVDNDAEHLVRQLRYRVFDAASGQWSVASPPVEAAPGREVLAFVEAIGPGGAVVAASGSADDPIRLQGPGVVTSPETPMTPEGGDDGWLPWVIGGVVIAVLGGVAIGIGVGLSENPSVTWQPRAPREVP